MFLQRGRRRCSSKIEVEVDMVLCRCVLGEVELRSSVHQEVIRQENSPFTSSVQKELTQLPDVETRQAETQPFVVLSI